jgi:hypothetical protein
MEPNYSSMSLVELKQHARERRIKQYYIMKRAQLIQLLAMQELPQVFKIEKMTIHQLRDEAKRKGVRGFWSLRRDQLVELLFPTDAVEKAATNKNEKDKGDANKHDDPQQHDPENVGVKNIQDAQNDRPNNGALQERLSLGSFHVIHQIFQE